ncbi:hypothetical protein G6F46_014662 [Rhizopus delemar]|nr:hypothetical protein G6F46_014662 [Rhizopus delemar]
MLDTNYYTATLAPPPEAHCSRNGLKTRVSPVGIHVWRLGSPPTAHSQEYIISLVFSSRVSLTCSSAPKNLSILHWL